MDLVLILAIFLSFYLVGEKISRLCRLDHTSPAEETLFNTALGLVAIALITTLLAFSGMIYPITGWVVMGTIFLASIKKMRETLRNLLHWGKSLRSGWQKRLFGNGFDSFNFWVLGALGLLAVTLALAPPTRTDTLVYHLAIPKAYLENHGIINLPNNMYSFFPLLMEMVFLFCMTFGIESLPQLAGLGMTFLLLAALTLFFKNRFGRRYALFVPVLYFSTPTFWEISASAYIDTALAGFFFLTYYSWDQWRTTQKDSWFWPMSIFAGAAWATKLTAFIILPLGFLGIALAGKNSKTPQWVISKTLLFGVTILVFMAPWWARNFYYSGNPFAPLFMQYLGGENLINWDSTRSGLTKLILTEGAGNGFLDFLRLPVNLTFLSQKGGLPFDGDIGILFLMLFPVVIWLAAKQDAPEKPSKQIFCLTLIFFILMTVWFLYFQRIRYLAPAFAFLTIIWACGLERMTRPLAEDTDKNPPPYINWMKRFIPFLVAVGILFNLHSITRDWLSIRPLPYILGKENRDQYLTRRLSVYPIYKAFNQTLGKDDKALFIFMRNYGYLCDRPFISDSYFEAHSMQAILKNDPSVKGITRQLKEKGVTHLMFDFNFVFGPSSAFSPKEQEALKVFFNKQTRLVKNFMPYLLYTIVLN